MSKTINKVFLLGRLGSDPEVKTFDNGGQLVNFNLATNEVYNNQQGEKQERTDWHRVVVGGNVSKVAEQYLKKGDLVHIEGRLRRRSFQDSEGNNRYIVEVRADNLTLLPNRGGQGQSMQDEQSQSDPAPQEKPDQQNQQEDDLPF